MEETKHEHNAGCCCQGCCSDGGHSHMHRHFLLRWLLAVLIIMVAFFVGVKVGEFKEAFWNSGFGGYGYGQYRMMRGYPNMMYYKNDGKFFNSSSTPYMMRWGR